MRQKTGLAQHKFAHRLEIMQSRFVAEVPKSVAHFRKQEFGLVPQAEQSLGTTGLFSGTSDCEDFFWGHCVGARITRIAPEGAVSAIVAAEIGQGDEYLA